MCQRKPCLKNTSYTALGTIEPPLSSLSTNALPPIPPADKPKQRRWISNVFVNDRGFPDQSDYYDNLLHNIEGGPILQKLKHPPPPLDEVDPKFFSVYDESKHGEQLRQDLDLSHLDTHLQEKIYALVKKCWSVFDKKGVYVPLKHYECVISTGDSPPIAVKKILYGPREIPIMRECIAALEKVGHIRQIFDGRWLFKALLAAKPHQEHVRDIAKFVWRFCVNYIPLNSIAYPIPWCDSAINEEFGMGQFYWLFDASMGYHQLAVAPDSQEKLAFQGPDTIKWTYTIMPFGPTNKPATFINFIHNVDSQWKSLAQSLGVVINDNTNTKRIIDDIFSWAKLLNMALLYMECQLRVCQSYQLSLSLQKSHIFPKHLEFVGINVCLDDNPPAMSKHQLLEHWPLPKTVHVVAKIIRFAQFYSKFIPHFDLRIAPLRALTTKFEYTNIVAPHWTATAQAAFEDIKQAILSNPCLKRFNHQHLIVLQTDFLSQGFGYIVCQPGGGAASTAAMDAYQRGSDFNFMATSSAAVLHPVAFGARRSRGNEVPLHSHLGEGFAGD
jgi:hypothetical protein